jgi:hypothetical protein
MNRIGAGACAVHVTLYGVDRASATGLTQARLDTACVGEQTKLPAELGRPVPCVAAGKKRIR